jgi:hypothetical protein
MNRVAEMERRMEDLWNLSVLYARRGARNAAMGALERAAAIALSYLASSNHEQLISTRSERMNFILLSLPGCMRKKQYGRSRSGCIQFPTRSE